MALHLSKMSKLIGDAEGMWAMATDHIGQSIRKIRREKDWSQFELATKAGVSQSVISRLEQGKTLGTGFNIVEKLYRALNEKSGGWKAREKWGVEPKTGDEIEDMLDEIFRKVFKEDW